MTSASSGTVLDGFMISKGLADGASTAQRSGAAIYATNSAPILRNLIVTLNTGELTGAAIYLGGTNANSASIIDCEIADNDGGTAVYATIPLTMLDCDLADNPNGALELSGPSIHSIVGCLFTGNDSTNGGGVARVNMTSANAYTLFDNCVMRNNEGARAGAIWYVGRGDHEIRNSRILGNNCPSPAISGGGILNNLEEVVDSLLIENSLISGNTCAGEGGGIEIETPGTTSIINATITGNSIAAPYGAGIDINIGTLTLNNTITWGNFGTGAVRQSISVSAPITVTVTAYRSLIQYFGIVSTPFPGTGTSGQDPLFVDADGPDNNFGTSDDNVRLMPGSPAIDAGSNLVVGPFIGADIYSSPRFADDTGTPDGGVPDGVNPIVDIGAAEFQSTTPNDCLADTNGDGILSPADFSAWIANYNNGC